MSATARQLRTPPDTLHPPLFTPAYPRPCCSGGGIAPPLMERPFFRQLHSALAPGGVLAVNYFGGRGAGLKQAWCRLRLEFGSGELFWPACDNCDVWARSLPPAVCMQHPGAFGLLSCCSLRSACCRAVRSRLLRATAPPLNLPCCVNLP